MTSLTVTTLLSFWIGLIVLTDNPPVDIKDYGKWQNARSSDGVDTYFRWLMDSKGVRSRERKGEMNLQCSSQEVIKILTDNRATSQWMSGIEECKTLERPGKNEWYTYTVFIIPWPFDKRDLVSLNRISNNSVDGITLIDVFCRDQYVPVKPDIVRMTDYKAQWKIVKISENQTRLIFIAESSTPPICPRYIQDPVIEKVFHNNLVRLKNLLEKK